MPNARRLRSLLPWVIGLALALSILSGIALPAALPLLRMLLASLLLLAALSAWIERRAPADAPLHRDPGVLALVAALAALLAILLSHQQRVTSDGIDHFVYLRSLFVDHDLDLANDYAAISPRRESVDPLTPLGRTGNLHPVGPALLWSPFYLLADLLCRLQGVPADGVGAPYRNAVALASLLYGWAGLVLLYRTALAFSDRAASLLAAFGIAFGTFLYWYLASAPTMAHATAFGAAAFFVWLWLSPRPSGWRRAALLGAATGLAALTRWPNALLALLPAVETIPSLLDRAGWRRRAVAVAVFVIAATVVFSPQMVVWRLLYGSWLTIPQGSAFLSSAPALGGVLFSPRHGLFSWSPLLYLGAVGLLILARRQPLRGLAAGLFFAALTRVNAGVVDWWGGAAFGARRFDAALPLLGLGLALAFSSLSAIVRRSPVLAVGGVLAAFVAWNLAFAAQFRARAWEQADAVAFEDTARGVAAVVDRSIGSPFSLPASLWTWMRTGRSPADYESLFMERRFNRWSIRLGIDDRMHLEDGWSAPRESRGESCRALVGPSAGLIVSLHRPAPYTLGLRVGAAGEAPTPPRLRVFVNQQLLGGLSVGSAWSDLTVAVPGSALRPGRNAIRIKIVEGDPGSVAVAAVWLDPAEQDQSPE